MIRLSSQKGFTLIELLVVIAIIGTLASVVLASLNAARGKARDANRLASLREMGTALELYYFDNNAYPLDSADQEPSSNSYLLSDIESFLTPTYISQIPLDPTYGNSASGYRYGTNPSGTIWDILVRLESNGTAWCKISSPAGSYHWATLPPC